MWSNDDNSPSEVVPKKYRAIMQGLVNCSAGLGGVFGALVCGSIYRGQLCRFILV